VTGTPTRGHALAHWASAEGTRSSTAQQGGRGERRWRRDADKQGVSSSGCFKFGKALGKMQQYGIGIRVRTRIRSIITHIIIEIIELRLPQV
jgi:hypothetical protein